MHNLSVQDLITNSIEEISRIADKLPGVVIVHDLRDWSVAWMSKNGLDQLGVSLEEVTKITAEEYYGKYFNKEDSEDYVPKILGLLQKNNDDEICTFFQQVRLRENEDWKWHFSSVKILTRDSAGNPLLTITMAFPIDSMHHMANKASRLLKENNFLRRNSVLYAKLSKRERDVLRLMALDKGATETSEELFISTHTVETHRKNIKKKLQTTSFYEICEYARAFDLI